jgi:hypothetical protein
MLETSLRQSEPVALPERPFGRVARSIAAHVLVTLLMTVTPMLVFVPAALLHCGLRNGRRAAWIASAIVLALFALPVAFTPAVKTDPSAPGSVSVALMAFAIMLPTLLALPLVERGTNFGRVLVFLIVTSFAGLAATEAISRSALQFSPYKMQVVAANEFNSNVHGAYSKNGAPSEWLRTVERSGRFTIFVLPALLLTTLSFVFVLSLLMLGRLRAWRELAASRGDGEAFGAYLFRNLSLPDWVLFAFIIGGLTPLATGVLQKVAANTLTVVVFLYVLQGLAIFRFLLLSTGAGAIQSFFGWMMLALITLLTAGAPVLLLGVAGLFDSFFDFRHFKKKRKDDSHESHSD